MSKIRYTGAEPGWMSGHETWSPGDEREIADEAEFARLLAGPFEAVADHVAEVGNMVSDIADISPDPEVQSKPSRTRKPQEA